MEYSISNNNNNTTNCSETASAEINIAFYVIAVVSFCILVIVSLFKKDETAAKKTYHSMYDGVALFSFTTFTVIIADLNYDSLGSMSTTAYHVYDMVMIILIGCIYLIFGACKFLHLPPESPGPNNMNVIGVAILIMILVLALMEMLLAVGCFMSDDSEELGLLLIFGMMQKLIQTGIYHHSKFRCFCKLRSLPIQLKSATWYFKIIALFNLSLWFESIIMAEKEGNSCLRTFIPKKVTAIYATCIIDYRLVCFFLFIEEALHIDYGPRTHGNNDEDTKGKETVGNEKKEKEKTYQQDRKLKSKKSIAFGSGFIVGGIILALQLFNHWPYQDESKAWANIFGMLTDLGLFIGVCILLHQMGYCRTLYCCATNSRNSSNSNISVNTNSHHIIPHAVNILVILMGIIGILFWSFKGLIMLTTARSCDAHSTYFKWFGSKFVIRTISLIFQIILFNRISDVKIITENKELNYKPWVDFALPLIILSFISVFVNSVIDTYNSIGEKRIHDTRITTVLDILYETGHPVHLGFCLHMTIHLCVLTYKFRKNEDAMEDKKVEPDREDGRSTCSRPSSEQGDNSIITADEKQEQPSSTVSNRSKDTSKKNS